MRVKGVEEELKGAGRRGSWRVDVVVVVVVVVAMFEGGGWVAGPLGCVIVAMTPLGLVFDQRGKALIEWGTS